MFLYTLFYVVSQIEAMVLGSLAWRSDSPLFEAIELKGSVPSYEEVCTQSRYSEFIIVFTLYCQVSIPVSSPETSKIASPFIHPRLKSLGAKGICYIRKGKYY